mgnify:CR=1 FL=1
MSPEIPQFSPSKKGIGNVGDAYGIQAGKDFLWMGIKERREAVIISPAAPIEQSK